MRFAALFTMGAVVGSYLLFPSWKMFPLWELYPSLDFLTVPLAVFYLLGLAVLLGISLRRPEVYIDDRWSLRQLYDFSGVILCALISALVAVHFDYLSWPIRSGGDESVHISLKLDQWKELKSGDIWYVYFLGSVAACAAVTFISVWIVGISQSSKSFRIAAERVAIAVILVLILLYIYRYCVVQLSIDWGSSKRWPPVGTLLGVASYALLGESEVSARIPSVLFYIGTGIVMFRLIAAISRKSTGLIAAALCLATPVFFEYGHLDFRDVGGAFFLLLGTFYLVKYLDTGDINSLMLSAVMAAVGYLERRPAAALVFVLYGSVLLMRVGIPLVRGQRSSLRSEVVNLFYAGAVFLWIVLPWYLSTSYVRPYKLHLENLLDLELISAYARMMPVSYGWPVIVLALAGSVVIVVRRSQAGAVALFGLIAFYLLFTADDPYWLPVRRFTVLMAPYLVLIGAFAVDASMQRLGTSKVWVPVWFLVASVPLYGWHAGRSLPFLLPKVSLNSKGYFPFDQLSTSLKLGLIKPGTLVYPHYWQTPFDVYAKWLPLEGYEFLTPKWRPQSERQIDKAGLANLCKQYACNALVLSGTKSEKGIAVVGVNDLDAAAVEKNRIPGFDVLKTVNFRGNWLAVAKPKIGSGPLH